MTTLFIILIIVASLILSLLVLVQNPKGGGLQSGFAGGANLMGVKRTGDILEKGTWILIIAIMVFSLAVNIMGSSSGSANGGLGDQIEAPVQAPNLNLNQNASPAPTTGTEAPAAAAPADSTN